MLVKMGETMAASVIAGFDKVKIDFQFFHNDYLLRAQCVIYRSIYNREQKRQIK
jgi:hypothetical protein